MRSTIAILAIALALAACGEKKDAYSGIPQQPQYQQPMQQAPVAAVPAQQAPAQPVIINNEQSSVMPALLGAAAGYMLGSAGNRSSNETRVVEREVTREVPGRSFGGYGPGPGPIGQTKIGSAVKPPVPSAPPTPAFAAPKPPVPAAPVVPAPSVKPNFTPGNYGTTTYNNAKPTMSVVPKPTQTPSYGGNSYKSAPSYGSSSYRSSGSSYSSSRSSGRR